MNGQIKESLVGFSAGVVIGLAMVFLWLTIGHVIVSVMKIEHIDGSYYLKSGKQYFRLEEYVKSESVEMWRMAAPGEDNITINTTWLR